MEEIQAQIEKQLLSFYNKTELININYESIRTAYTLDLSKISEANKAVGEIYNQYLEGKADFSTLNYDKATVMRSLADERDVAIEMSAPLQNDENGYSKSVSTNWFKEEKERLIEKVEYRNLSKEHPEYTQDYKKAYSKLRALTADGEFSEKDNKDLSSYVSTLSNINVEICSSPENGDYEISIKDIKSNNVYIATPQNNSNIINKKWL